MKRLFPPRVVGLFLSVALSFAATAAAHEVRPAYLRIQQTAADQFDLLWRVPARGDLRLGIYVRLPEHCANVGEPLAWQDEGTWVLAETLDVLERAMPESVRSLVQRKIDSPHPNPPTKAIVRGTIAEALKGRGLSCD